MFEYNYLMGLLDLFNIPKADYSFTTLSDGLVNDTFLVSLNSRPKYILQRINHQVFKSPPKIMSNISRALNIVGGPGYAEIDIIHSKEGNGYIKYEGNYWRLMSFIKDSTTYNSTVDPKVAYGAGWIVGKFHNLMQNERGLDYHITLKDFHNLDFRLQQLDAATKIASTERLSKASMDLVTIESLLEEVKDWNNQAILKRICHNDTKLNNILFATNKQPLCLIDLDTIMEGYFYNDFGDIVRSVVSTAAENELDLSKITFDLELLKSILKGIKESGVILKQAEIESLYLGVVFMPLIHGIRAVTDYLKNDKYYKVSYKDQNLDRANALLYFATKARAFKDTIKSLIQEILG
ncbi:phosphotransferase enzyme family protein [Aegicerativicinus sediminis]